MSRSLTTQTPSVASGSMAVPSAAGFNAGDLIYYRNGDYGRVPDGAVSTATFVNTTAQPTAIIPGTQGVENITNPYGGSVLQNSAVLTNGNVVQVFTCNRTIGSLSFGNIYFQIVNSSGTVVVSPTQFTGGTISNYGQVGVIALTGGGFVVYGCGDGFTSAYCLAYGVYTNTGSVTTAPVSDTTVAAQSTNIQVTAVALANGGFVITGLWASSPVPGDVYHRIYNSVGTALYAWTGVGTYAGSGIPDGFGIGIAARSDSSFIIVFPSNGTYNAVTYFIRNATNTFITAGTISSGSIFTTSGSLAYLCSATTMSDGTTFVIATTGYTGSSGDSFRTAYRKIPTGNVLGNEIVLPSGLGYLYSNNSQNSCLSMKGLSNNNLMIVYSSYNYGMRYAVTNSADQFLTGSSAKTFDSAVLYSGSTQQVFTPAIIEVGSNVWVYYTAYYNGKIASSLAYIKIDSTNFDLVAISSSVPKSIIVGNAPVNTYALSGSSPSIAKFTASISGSVSTTTAQGVAFGPSKVAIPDTSSASAQYTTSVASMASAVFYDGSFVIVTRSNASPYKINANLYTAQGAFVRQIFVSNANINSITTGSLIDVTTLTGGNFVVMWPRQNATSNELEGSIFTKDGDFVSSIVTQANWLVGDSQRKLALAGISNNRFVLVAANSANTDIAYAVYDSSGNQLKAQTNFAFATGSITSAQVSATPIGFVISYMTGGTNARFLSVIETATNTFANFAGWSAAVAGASNIVYNQLAVAGTCYVGFYPTSATNVNTQCLQLNGVSSIASNSFAYGNMSTSSSDTLAACAVPSGGVISCGPMPGGSATNTIQFNYTPLAVPSVTSSGYGGSQTFTLAVSWAQSNGNASFQLKPLYGSYVLFTWNDQYFNPWFAIINAKSENVAVALVSGTTQSGNVGITPGTNGSGLTNYVFQGVATTSASAGGTGQVQTTGPALLNSSYSASTAAQSFDHQMPNGSGIPGNKGTIVGRSVTLLGNS